MVWLHFTLTLKGQFQGHSEFEADISYNRRVRPYVTIRQYRKIIYGMHYQVWLWVTLKSKSFIVYHKGAELGYMLLLNTSRKSYMKSPSPIEPSRFTLGNIESTN